MISLLTGTIAYVGDHFVIVDVGGVGYQVLLPPSVAHGLSGMVTLYTYEVTRDDARELVGFTTVSGLELCSKLIDVPGVGPKLAQKIVFGGRTAEEVAEHIDNGDVAFLSGISGVGKKTAQKIVLELQGTLIREESTGGDQDAFEALVGLGCPRAAVLKALQDMSADIVSTEDRIKEALRMMGKV